MGIPVLGVQDNREHAIAQVRSLNVLTRSILFRFRFDQWMMFVRVKYMSLNIIVALWQACSKN